MFLKKIWCLFFNLFSSETGTNNNPQIISTNRMAKRGAEEAIGVTDKAMSPTFLSQT